jgi:hypothetical protein
VRKSLGARFGSQYRVWFLDHAMHVNPSRYLMPTEGGAPAEHHGPTDTHIVSYAGVLQQALRDVAAWAEKGIAPLAETGFVCKDSQIVLPARAAQRRGIQQVVDLTANGGSRAEVKVGETVNFVGVIETPAGAGEVVSAEWDYDGAGRFADTESYKDGAARRTVKRSHAFDKPGTCIVAVRVVVQRKNAVGTPFAKIINLGRARVVVA